MRALPLLLLCWLTLLLPVKSQAQNPSSLNFEQSFGINSWAGFGGGPGVIHPKASRSNFEPKIYDIKRHRLFLTIFRFFAEDQLAVQPTPQNWYLLTQLQQLKADSIAVSIAPEGKFPTQNTKYGITDPKDRTRQIQKSSIDLLRAGKANKVPPINEEDDPYKPESWQKVYRANRLLAILLTDLRAFSESQIEALQKELDAASWRPGTYQDNILTAGLDLMGHGDAIEGWNELNSLWHGGTRFMDARAQATCDFMSYSGWRSIDTTVAWVQGGCIGRSEAYQLTYWKQFISLCEVSRIPMVNISAAFHWYVRSRAQNQDSQGNDYGISPEQGDVVGWCRFMDSLVRTLKPLGVKDFRWTETGYAAGEGYLDQSVQRTPVQEGLSQVESQGALIIRTQLICLTFAHFGGIDWWCEQNGKDAGGYFNGGLHTADWQERASLKMIREFIAQYGSVRWHTYFEENDIHSVTGNYPDGEPVTLYWTDGKRIGAVGPVPAPAKITVPEPPTPPLSESTITIHALELDGYGRISLPQPIKLILSDQ